MSAGVLGTVGEKDGRGSSTAVTKTNLGAVRQ